MRYSLVAVPEVNHGGKSILGCYWILKMCMKYPGTRWVIGRNVLKTLKETTLNSFLLVCRIQGIKPGVHYKFNATSNIFTFRNGSEVLLKQLFHNPSDPNFDELGSLEITGAFVDECNQVVEKAWEVLKSRIRYRLDEYGLIPKMLGSCNPSKNWVFRRFFKPWKSNQQVEYIVDEKGEIRSYARRFIQSLVTDNPEISKHYINNLRSMSDVAIKERLLRGNWEYDDNPNMLCSFQNILAVISGNVPYKTGKYYLTADVARYGADKAVILVWDGFCIVNFCTFDKSSSVEIEDAIQYYRQFYRIPRHHCIADDDGIGGSGPVDHLGIIGFVNNGKAFTRRDEDDIDHETGLAKEFTTDEQFYNLQAQCAYKLASFIQDNMICFDYGIELSSDMRDEITTDLEQLQSWETDKDRKGLRIKPKDAIKEDIGRSPDWRDALLMRMYFVYAEDDSFNYETLL